MNWEGSSRSILLTSFGLIEPILCLLKYFWNFGREMELWGLVIIEDILLSLSTVYSQEKRNRLFEVFGSESTDFWLRV